MTSPKGCNLHSLPPYSLAGLSAGGGGMGLSKWYKDFEKYTRYKWEFLRRNPEYQKDFDELDKQPYDFDNYLWCAAWNLSDEVEQEREAFRKRWGLRFPINHRHPYDEIPDYHVKWHIYYWARGDDASKERHGPVEVVGEYRFLMDLWFASHRWEEESADPSGTESDWRPFIEQWAKGTELTLNVDLKYDRKVIMDGVKIWLEFIEKGKRFIQPDKSPVRDRHYFDLYPKYLEVWDLRQQGRPFPEIARTIFPNDFIDQSERKEGDPHPNPGSALVKVQKYYREADRLIKSGI